MFVGIKETSTWKKRKGKTVKIPNQVTCHFVIVDDVVVTL